MLQTRRPALSGNALKGIAILAMTLDHLTWTLWPGYAADWWVLVCHLLGRVTAPIMWFFIVEGYHYTHDVKKYAVRLFALAAGMTSGRPFLRLTKIHCVSARATLWRSRSRRKRVWRGELRSLMPPTQVQAISVSPSTAGRRYSMKCDLTYQEAPACR